VEGGGRALEESEVGMASLLSTEAIKGEARAVVELMMISLVLRFQSPEV